MPELPEVETTVKYLSNRAHILCARFIDIWSDWEKIVKKPKSFEQFKKEIKNKKIERIWRRAKNIIFDLSDESRPEDIRLRPSAEFGRKPSVEASAEGYSLLVHQRMTGHLLVGIWNLESGIWKPVRNDALKDSCNRFLHMVFYLDNGKMLALSDARKFAKVELWKTSELLGSKEFKKLGPEPLDSSFTFEKFEETLQSKKGGIKQVLMDQNVIAGIGNIYSSEILWWAKIHPKKNVAKLNEKELKLLYQFIKKVLELGVKLGGESFSDYRKPDGSKGDFDTKRKAYRREGQKCSRCQTKIKRIKVGQRSAFFCPHCQKM